MDDTPDQIAERPVGSPPGSRRGRPARTVLSVAVVLAILAAGGFAFRSREIAASAPAAAHAPDPVPVSAVRAVSKDLPIERSGLGTVTPENRVDVKVRIDGQLERLDFREGQNVRKGDILAEIDPRPYAAALAQAEAVLQKDAAQLGNAKADEARAVKLTASGAGTSQAADAARLQVAMLQAAIAGDQAVVDTAKLNLGYATVRAPISGRAGLRQVDEGTLLHASDATGIVTITQIDPVAVEFSLPQDQLPALFAGQAQAALAVSVETRDRSRHVADGRLTVIDSQIDTGTGMVKLKAEFPNANDALWPGQLVTARIVVSTERNAVAVPSVALQNGQKGPYLFVVKPDNTVTIAQVETGATVGDLIAVTSGLKPGDDVVTAGQSRLAEGTPVSVTQTDDASQHIALETR